MLTGFLKVAAVAVVTGGFAGGIYWAVQISESEGSSPLVQAETTLTAEPSPPASPTLSTTPPQPTPSPPPGTPPAIDTSAWLTYTSPFGFTFDYPPDWTLDGAESLTPISVRGVEPDMSVFLLNPVFFEARQRALEASGKRPGEFLPPPGAVKADIIVQSRRVNEPFDAQAYIAQCEDSPGAFAPPGSPFRVAEQMIADDRTVILCLGTDYSQDPPIPWTVRWIELASGQPLLISPGMIQPADADITRVDAILASFTFSTLP